MELMITTAIALAVALAVRRREALSFRWQPTRHTWVAAGSGLLAFALSGSLLLLDEGSLLAQIILYGGIFFGCGFAIPWGYTLLVERRGPAALGLRRERWAVSLTINLALGILFSLLIVFQADLRAMNWPEFGKAAVVVNGAGGLFELFLFYGFIHLRLKKAFGMIPAILVTSVLYVAWHVGTQLPLEPDPVAAAAKLFAVGVMYQSVFSLTYNLLIIWPFFHFSGVMLDVAVNIDAVGVLSLEFPWALGSLCLMGATAFLLIWLVRRRSQPADEGASGKDQQPPAMVRSSP
jgi:membrane protease YdiL (CAAX protease family)